MKKKSIFLVILALCIFVAGSVHAEEEEVEVVDKTIKIDCRPQSLYLGDFLLAHVDVVISDIEDPVVVIQGKKEIVDQIFCDINYGDNTVSIKGTDFDKQIFEKLVNAKRESYSGLNQQATWWPHIMVKVPTHTSVQVNGVFGDTVIGSSNGAVFIGENVGNVKTGCITGLRIANKSKFDTTTRLKKQSKIIIGRIQTAFSHIELGGNSTVIIKSGRITRIVADVSDNAFLGVRVSSASAKATASGHGRIHFDGSGYMGLHAIQKDNGIVITEY